MANAYKGLTVEIGGDSKKLQVALKAAKNAASDAQAQLKLVNSALNFRTDDLTAAETKLTRLEEKAQDLGAQIEISKRYMEQLGDETVEIVDLGKSVETFSKLGGTFPNSEIKQKKQSPTMKLWQTCWKIFFQKVGLAATST